VLLLGCQAAHDDRIASGGAGARLARGRPRRLRQSARRWPRLNTDRNGLP
jgi:hypothetical protein